MKRTVKNKEIVAGCQADKPESQRQLYDKYCGLVFGIALRYTQNTTDAEDIAQDAFVKIFINIKQLRNGDAITSWIKSITTNAALDFLKLKNNNSNLIPLDDLATDIVDIYCEHYESVPEAQLLQFIQELPDGYRTVFNLCAIDGYKQEEVAQILGCSYANVRSQYFKAKKILKEKIENYE